VWAQTSGFIFEPGVSAQLPEVRVGFDVQFWFWHRYGFLTGVATDTKWRTRVYVAGSYQVYRNTSLFVGVDNKKQVIAGVRLAF
jgi:hypothetical protein